MILYKYRDISNLNCFKYTLDSLKNKYLYFSRPSELNDPFDCQIQYDLTASDEEYLQWIEKNCSRIPPGNLLLTVDGIKKLVKQGKAISGLAQYSHSIVEINHVLSLTSDCYNASMWAKYAGNYNGICIGYNVDASKGYGFLWNNPAVGRATFGCNYTEWVSEATKEMDYWITVADTPKQILEN